MADVALSNIIHGNADGSVSYFNYGEPVTGLTKKEIEVLKASGSIGPEPMAASDAMSEIESLKAQLLEAQALLAEKAAAEAASKPDTK